MTRANRTVALPDSHPILVCCYSNDGVSLANSSYQRRWDRRARHPRAGSADRTRRSRGRGGRAGPQCLGHGRVTGGPGSWRPGARFATANRRTRRGGVRIVRAAGAVRDGGESRGVRASPRRRCLRDQRGSQHRPFRAAQRHHWRCAGRSELRLPLDGRESRSGGRRVALGHGRQPRRHAAPACARRPVGR